MITTLEKAKGAQARRKASGLRGIAKAVRRFFWRTDRKYAELG